MVSKVMSSADPWQRQIDMLFEELSKYCEIRLNRDCAMHIHVSPSLDPARSYRLDDLKMIMKGIAYFDDAITKIMPADRKENPWAVSNFNSREAPRDLYNAYAQVPYASWGPLFQRIDGIKMKQLVFRALGENRNMSWNFGNITSQCGTVEFRRPPGVQSAAAAKHWAAFTLSFIAQAMSEDWSQKQSAKEYPKVQRLLLFLVDGVNKLERASKNALNSSLIREDHSAPAVYSTAALQTIGAKMADKRRKGSVFVTKVSLRPVLQHSFRDGTNFLIIGKLTTQQPGFPRKQSWGFEFLWKVSEVINVCQHHIDIVSRLAQKAMLQFLHPSLSKVTCHTKLH